MDWTGPVSKNDALPARPGIYRILLVSTNDRRSIPIARLLGTDPEGVLCIGKAGSLSRRLYHFRRAAERRDPQNYASHSEGNLLRMLCERTDFEARYGPWDWMVSFFECEADGLAEAEQQAIREYFRVFGEVPPINSAIPGRYVQW